MLIATTTTAGVRARARSPVARPTATDTATDPKRIAPYRARSLRHRISHRSALGEDALRPGAPPPDARFGAAIEARSPQRGGRSSVGRAPGCGPGGRGFEWTVPSDELFRFHLEQVGELGGYLLGRRLYETMLVWETDPSLREARPEIPPYAPGI